jgi:hypothetical protein
MKKLFLLLLLFLTNNVFSQEKYTFDYYTLYEYKADLSDTKNNKELNFSNSNDNGYLLTILLKKDTIFSAVLTDYKNSKINIYKDSKHNNTINDVKLFNNINSFPYSLENCLKSKKYSYKVNYTDTIDKKIISIEKISKRKRTVSKSFFEMEPTTITKNQEYNFPILATPLWCQKFNLVNEDLIKKSYFVENNKTIHIRTLKEIQKTDLTLIVTAAKNNIK